MDQIADAKYIKVDQSWNLTSNLDQKCNSGGYKTILVFEIYDYVSNCNFDPLSNSSDLHFGPF